MALIDPFRKLVVYPSLLRSVRASWNQTFETAGRKARAASYGCTAADLHECAKRRLRIYEMIAQLGQFKTYVAADHAED